MSRFSTANIQLQLMQTFLFCFIESLQPHTGVTFSLILLIEIWEFDTMSIAIYVVVDDRCWRHIKPHRSPSGARRDMLQY